MSMNDAAQAVTAVSFFGSLAIAIRSIAQVWGKRLDTRRDPYGLEREQSPVLEAMEQRLARIEAAVDTIAVEVERISEAQRFAARLAAERDQRHVGSLPPGATEARTVTPH
jgi:hypothetical protein